MKKALVTGSAGLLGRHFCHHLRHTGWEVETADLLNGEDAHDIFSDCARLYHHYDTSIYDLVVHAAYHVGGREAIDGVNVNLVRNLELDAAMFRWALTTKQRRVIYFSSSAAYPVEYQTQQWIKRWGNREGRLKEEDISLAHPLPPDAGYGWAKLTGEHLAKMARANGLSVTVVRPFSGYAEDQDLDYPFPSIAERVLLGEYHVWGPRGQTRDWIHISDVVEAVMAVMESGTEDPVNICSGAGVEMGDLMTMMIHQAHDLDPRHYPRGQDVEVGYLEDKPTGVFHRVGNSERMLEYYTPRVGLEEGVFRALSARLSGI